MKINLNDFQNKFVSAFTASNGYGLLASRLGSGKTLAALSAVYKLLSNSGSRVLIIAPLHTHDNWVRHLELDNFACLDLKVVVLSPKIIKSGTVLNNIANTGANTGGNTNIVYIIGWELFRRQEWQKISNKLHAVIVDETHRQQNPKSKNHKTIMQLKNVPIKLALSATPAGNRPEGIFATLQFLNPDNYTSYWRFVTKYMLTRLEFYGGRQVNIIDGEKNPGKIREDFGNYWVDDNVSGNGSVKTNTQKIKVKLSPRELKPYKELEKNKITRLDNPGEVLGIDLPITLEIRLRQLTLGIPIIDSDGEVTYPDDTKIKSSKLETMLSILEDIPSNKKIVVWTHSARFVSQIRHVLELKHPGSTITYTGNIKGDISRFLDPEDHTSRYLLTTPRALGEGFDGLQKVSHIEIWLSEEVNMIMNEQARGRLNRTGQTQTVTSYYLEAADTIDGKVVRRLENRKETIKQSGLI